MKKVLFSLALVVAGSAAFAQVNKGQWLAGGNVAFTASKTGDFKTNTFNFSPDAGYFFINNLAGGLRIDLNSSKQSIGDVDNKTSGFSIAPFARYYFLPAAQKVNVFADASYAFGSQKEDDGEDKVTTNINTLSIMAGPAIFLTPNTALEVTVGYASSKIEHVEKSTGTIAFGVGFQIHLGGKK